MPMRTAFTIIPLLLLSLASQPAFAQPVRPVGNVQSVEVGDRQLRLQTDNASVELTVYSPSVIRVRIDKQKLGRDFSYAVVAKPVAGRTTVTQDDAAGVLSTDAL